MGVATRGGGPRQVALASADGLAGPERLEVEIVGIEPVGQGADRCVDALRVEEQPDALDAEGARHPVEALADGLVGVAVGADGEFAEQRTERLDLLAEVVFRGFAGGDRRQHDRAETGEQQCRDDHPDDGDTDAAGHASSR